jgi:alcohol dehydrogenase (NADP+)
VKLAGLTSPGGYSSALVAGDKYVIPLPPNLPLHAATPLMCAGVTTWSPISRYVPDKGEKLHVGIVGLGGLVSEGGLNGERPARRNFYTGRDEYSM